jgi:hypothetical protein
MSAQQIKFRYGATSGVITWDDAQASAPILLDGVETGFQTADASHNLNQAIELVLTKEFGDPVSHKEVEIRC